MQSRYILLYNIAYVIYDVTYETISHTHPGISTVADMVEYSPHNKGIELENYSLLTLSGINPERSLETHKIFHN